MKRLLIVLSVLTLLPVVGCTPKPATSEQIEAAYRAAEEVWEEASSSPKTKLRAARDFLKEHPDTRYTVRVVGRAVELLAEDMGNPAEAEKLVRDARGRVKDPVNARRLGVSHVEALASLKRVGEIEKVAATLRGDNELAFFDQVRIAEAAIGAEAWETALVFATAASELTADKLRAQSSAGRYPTEEDLQRALRKRQAWALGDKGWAEAGMGRIEAALATFEKGAALDARQIMGNSETSLPLYHARTLLKAGRAAEALEVLAPNALYGGDKEALATIEQAWKASGGEGDVQEYLWQERMRRAVVAPDFTLPDYDGQEKRFSNLSKDRVTLLAFWFPT